MNRKQTLILTIVFLLTFLALALSATFAWFAGFDISLETADNSASSATTETLVYNAGAPISIFADYTNFGEGMSSLKGNTSCSATLTTGSNKQEMTYNYDVKLVITENDFVYTQGNTKPELLLIIKDPEGKPLDKLGNLKYVKVGDYQGFDITQAKGTYDVALNYPLTTATTITHKWNVEVIFVNYNEDQNLNKGRTLLGRLEIGTSGKMA